MNNTLIKLKKKKSDFENNLFLKQEVKELKEKVETLIRERNSYKHKYNKLSNELKSKARDEVLKDIRKEVEKELVYNKEERNRLKLLVVEQELYKQQQNEIKRLNNLLKN